MFSLNNETTFQITRNWIFDIEVALVMSWYDNHTISGLSLVYKQIQSKVDLPLQAFCTPVKMADATFW